MGGRYLETRRHEHSRCEGTNQRAHFTIFIFYLYLVFPNETNHLYCCWEKFQKSFSPKLLCCGLYSASQPPVLCATPEFGDILSLRDSSFLSRFSLRISPSSNFSSTLATLWSTAGQVMGRDWFPPNTELRIAASNLIRDRRHLLFNHKGPATPHINMRLWGPDRVQQGVWRLLSPLQPSVESAICCLTET